MININMLEINKPSELSQVLFVKGNNLEDIGIVKITPGQIDLINCIYYKVKEMILRNNLTISKTGTTSMDLLLSDIAINIEKYKGGQYKKIMEDLITISTINIVINSLGKNKEEDTMLVTKFILEMEVSRHRKNLHKKKVSLLLSNKLIHKFINVKKYFAKMFLKIQFSLSSKYSKLLYELLKDYEKINSISVEMNMLVYLLNDICYKEWSVFRVNVLERAIKEINDKSDIMVSYEPIKEKLEGQRKQVTKVKFHIKKQPETRLRKLGLIEDSITSHTFYNKSKTKLDSFKKNGYKVVNEEMWITTDINKNEEQYASELRIDGWLKETSQDDQNALFEVLASNIDDCDDPIVCIDDYVIRGVFSKHAFTKKPNETIEILNQTISLMTE